MAEIIDKTFNFFKNETVFSVSLILAIISCFFVKPNINYLNYINWDTIILLSVIMIIVEILKNLTVFEFMVRKLLTKTGNTQQLLLILVFICFFSSIFITNDVSLIIFVPFSIMALKKVKRADLIIITVCLQTIAANVGCMVLPVGAPHNIVLYTLSHIPFETFFLILVPYIIVSVIFLIIILSIIPKEDITIHNIGKVEFTKKNFFKRVFRGVDYYLLLTFITLFILIGNLENITFFSLLFKRWIIGNEVLCGVLVSQVISNVPTAMLLSGFSKNFEAIIVGINIGGFGTLIASMANLISYNIIVRECNEFKHRYLIIFTVLNIILLLLLLSVHVVI
ncbi:SLC13 family permease [Methanosphaera sp. ISO3-F5]|uniref:SLC13 family permease n=1 Tax=Methanosphaera sp. ISO3-F5 TaxID=1452353 RepID=UPI002B260C82|nr:SLC13 family permease [Methanosphaera sp. ISO3-F5]WQH64683.1 SLC13 family permease [Methanosphaera sp. ISO3-F5]